MLQVQYRQYTSFRKMFHYLIHACASEYSKTTIGWRSSDVVLRGTASPRGSLEAEFSLPRPRSRSRPLMSWPWPRSRLICLGLNCYCLEAPIPVKPILLLQLIAFIKVTRKYEQNRRKIPLGLCPKATNRSCITCNACLRHFWGYAYRLYYGKTALLLAVRERKHCI